MRVLVTGGGGFVASNAVRRLLADGIETLVLDRAPLDEVAQEAFAPWADGLTAKQADVAERNEVERALAGERITHVIHAATLTHAPGWEREQPARFLEVNVLGTVNLLEWARAAPGLRRFVFVSTGGVYGEPTPWTPEGPQREEGPFNPPELYAISKYAAELTARRYGELFPLDVRAVRLSGVFGPLERATGSRKLMSLPYWAAHAAVTGRPLRVTARTLDAGGDFLSATDIADAFARLVPATGLAHDAYNVAFGRFTPVRELLEAFGAELAVETVGDPAEADVDMDPADRLARWNAYDIGRVQADTGWEPRPLAEQVREYLDWVRADPTRR